MAPHIAMVEAGAEDVETAVREVADKAELKLGKLAQPLRAALTGSNTSPGIFDVLVLLGRARVEERVSLALERIRGG